MKTIQKGPFLLWGKTMALFLGIKICILCFFGGIKMPKVKLFPVHNNSCSEFVFCRPPLNAKYSGFVVLMCATLVVKILAHSGFTKIHDSVVSRVAVNMVYKILRKLSVYIKPRESMCLESSIPDGDVATALAAIRASNITRFSAFTGNTPNKFTSFGIVREKFSQAFRSKFFFYNTSSHDDSFKVRLVRACVAVTTPRRFVQFTGAGS